MRKNWRNAQHVDRPEHRGSQGGFYDTKRGFLPPNPLSVRKIFVKNDSPIALLRGDVAFISGVVTEPLDDLDIFNNAPTVKVNVVLVGRKNDELLDKTVILAQDLAPGDTGLAIVGGWAAVRFLKQDEPAGLNARFAYPVVGNISSGLYRKAILTSANFGWSLLHQDDSGWALVDMSHRVPVRTALIHMGGGFGGIHSGFMYDGDTKTITDYMPVSNIFNETSCPIRSDNTKLIFDREASFLVNLRARLEIHIPWSSSSTWLPRFISSLRPVFSSGLSAPSAKFLHGLTSAESLANLYHGGQNAYPQLITDVVNVWFKLSTFAGTTMKLEGVFIRGTSPASATVTWSRFHDIQIALFEEASSIWGTDGSIVSGTAGVTLGALSGEGTGTVEPAIGPT